MHRREDRDTELSERFTYVGDQPALSQCEERRGQVDSDCPVWQGVRDRFQAADLKRASRAVDRGDSGGVTRGTDWIIRVTAPTGGEPSGEGISRTDRPDV